MNEKTPAKLKASAKLWKQIVASYNLRPDELRLLEDCCREMDIIDRLQAEVDDNGVTVSGSMGQTVIHPAIQEVRQHRNVLKQMWAKLALPDATPASSTPSDKARAVAHARWQRKPA